MSYDPIPAARALLATRATHRPAGPLPPRVAPIDDAQGMAVQVALASLLGEQVPGGYKIGATAAHMQAYLGLAGPLGAFMARSGIVASGAVLPFSALCRPGTECEIGVRLACDLPAGTYTAEEAAGCVGEVFAAMEIVENRYLPPDGDLRRLGTATLIADQIFHGGAVLGIPAPDRHALHLGAIRGRMLVDGAERGTGVGADLLGHPYQALAWLAGSQTAHAFGGLRAGQVMMLGSVTPTIWLDGPCVVEVIFEGLSPVTLTLS